MNTELDAIKFLRWIYKIITCIVDLSHNTIL